MELNDKTTTHDYGYYFLFDEISPLTVQPAIEFILEKNFQCSLPHLNLVISSEGGCVSSAFALIDTIKGSKIPIRTIGLGIIASAGLLIFMAGHEGDRILTPNTSLLSHQYWWGSYGKEHELFAAHKEYSLTSDRIMRHYKKCTKLKNKLIRKYLLPPHDVWLSAQEAHNLKLCDHIKEVY